MNYIDQIIKKYKSLPAREKRVALFNYVRDLPYKITGKQDPKLLYFQRKGDCAAKSKLLSLLFRRLGYQTRLLLVRYKLRRYPSEVKYIPDQIDYHHALQVKINQKWVTVDATYDKGLVGKGFKVNSWDGVTNTPLAEKPIAIKRGKERNASFDRQFKLFIEKLKETCKLYPKELENYTREYNKIIIQSRRER